MPSWCNCPFCPDRFGSLGQGRAMLDLAAHIRRVHLGAWEALQGAVDLGVIL